ncbi:hypothetical protein C5S30_00990 [ANME-1 cluster archaeon GoMg4]|nr:hypothetical protein [ANME-1 cluster archaeon GoMg4]
MMQKARSDEKNIRKAYNNGGGYVGGNRFDLRINGFNKVSKNSSSFVLVAILVVSVFVILAFAGTASAETFTVNETGWWNETWGYNASSTPIQSAINNATTGDNINVVEGTYDEQVVIDKSLTLQSVDGAEATIIDGEFADEPAVIVIQGTDITVTFEGFTVLNPADVGDETTWLEGILVGGLGDEAPKPKEVHIKNNILVGGASNCIEIARLTGSGVHASSVTGNHISLGINPDPYYEGSGISVWHTNDVLISNNTVCDSENGIEVIGKSDYGGAYNTTITGNLVKNNTCAGITVYANSVNTTITNNDINANNWGLFLMGDWWGGGSAPDGTQFHFNNVTNNTEWGIKNGYSPYAPEIDLDAINNWWGDENGPSGEGVGSGDAVSENVDYEPWLMAPWPSAETEETVTETIDGDGTMTDTPTGGNVTINATGNHTITTAKYAENPGGTPTFKATGDYWDVHLDNATNVTNVTIKFCPAGPSDTIYYWDAASNSWKPCSDQVYADGCITVTITSDTEPSLEDLTGQEFGRGTPEQVPVLTPLGIIALIGILSVVLAVATLRRRG